MAVLEATRQQAELKARSNAERQEQQDVDQAEQDKRALQDWLIPEMRRSQEADPRLAAMMQLHAQPSSTRQQETAVRTRPIQPRRHVFPA
jgi:hypothetical protein